MQTKAQTAGRWLNRSMILILVAANAAIVWFSYQSLALSKHHAELSAETHAANIAEAIHQNLTAGFEQVDLLMGSVAEEMRRQIDAGRFSIDSIGQYVRVVKPSLQVIHSVVINDAKGETLLVEGANGPKVNVADRDYFVTARSADRPPLIVSKLLFSRISGQYVTLVAHRVESRDGKFLGVVAGSILATYLQAAISAYDLGSQGTIVLRDTNGALIAKFDPQNSIAGQMGSLTESPRFLSFVQAESKTEVLRSYEGNLWTQRISVLRHLEKAPMVVEVSVGTENYLRGWWDQVGSTAGLDLGFLLLSLITGFVLLRAVRRIELEKARFQNARDMAESSNMAKGQFLANMSHELRTPMNAVLGMHELLLGTELTPRQKDYVLKSRTAAASLLDILNGILDFSKIEAGKLDLEAVPFPLETLLRELSVIVSSSLGDKELELLYDVDPRVPPYLVGDPLRLKQILINLCGNAVKFTQSGEIIVEVKPDETLESRLRFSVVDSGLGISPEQKAIIFHAFSQADVSTSRRFGGTGLGLTISQRLVRMMGGTITVDSEPGQGSRFSFSLPLSSAPGPAVLPAQQRAVIVSRNAAARRILADMAATAAWPCEVYPSVAEAEKSLNPEASWTVAVVDLWTVETADWMACTRLRKTIPSIRVLGLVNPHQLEAVRASASAPAGFHGFLVKPFTIPMLAEAVVELAGGDLPAPERKPLPRRLEGVRLLVAEDNPFNQQVALELLESEGALVSVACDGAEAIVKLGEAAVPFDAVLMDMRMPGMDGLEATRLIRRTLGMTDLPIIAMTANALPSDKAACFEAGMDDHIAKPIGRDKLVETLGRFVRRSEPTAAVFDGAAALERLGNDEATLDKVLAFWLRSSETLGTELETAAGDTERLTRYFHSLKGSAATVGGAALSQFAARMERLLLDRPKDFELESVARETRELVAALVRAVENHLKTVGVS